MVGTEPARANGGERATRVRRESKARGDLVQQRERGQAAGQRHQLREEELRRHGRGGVEDDGQREGVADKVKCLRWCCAIGQNAQSGDRTLVRADHAQRTKKEGRQLLRVPHALCAQS